jgi:acyl carrier protein
VSAGDNRASSDWQEFAERIAELTGRPAELISPEARLMRDLALDSLALAELGVSLREAYERPDHPIRFEDRDWEQTTAGDLFEDCVGARRPLAT